MTPQREMILDVIAHSPEHMTAEEVHERIQVRSSAVNIATVYRTLDMLVEEGLACRTDLGQGQLVYSTGMHGPHIHLICKKCGAIQSISHHILLPFSELLEKEHGFLPDLHHLSFFGVCNNEECMGALVSEGEHAHPDTL